MFGCAPAGGNYLSNCREAAAKSKSAKSINTDNMFSVKLNNGVEMPAIGFGTWAIADGSDVVEAVKTAIECGFRHIDTASFYKNEEGVGRGIAESGVSRGNLWVTTKVWPTETGYDNTLRAFDASLKRLGLDYIDLYLIHWPVGDYLKSWKIMEQLYTSGRIRSLGVSNFTIPELKNLLSHCELYPMVNQLEIHPFCQQKELRRFCVENEIQCEAWSPFCRGRIFNHPVLQKIAEKRNKTIAQIVLRWDNQNDVIAIPQAVDPKLIENNFQIFDFELSDAEMAEIDALDTGKALAFAPLETYERETSVKK